MSPLVSVCLVVHLKKTINNVTQYGYPVGTLTIATAVVRKILFDYFYQMQCGVRKLMDGQCQQAV